MENKENFFSDEKKWKVYDKILVNNYMYHEEMTTCLKSVLDDRMMNQRFAFADLGSGDASFVVKALAGTSIGSYTAFDLSGYALELARTNIAPMTCTKTFIQSDLLEGLKASQTSYDFIWSCFALHHLHSDQKYQLFKYARKFINQRGIFCLTDLYRRQGQTMQGYLEEYFAHMHKDWSELNEDELTFVKAHIAEADYPETHDSLIDMARTANFPTTEIVLTKGFYVFMIFSP